MLEFGRWSAALPQDGGSRPLQADAEAHEGWCQTWDFGEDSAPRTNLSTGKEPSPWLEETRPPTAHERLLRDTSLDGNIAFVPFVAPARPDSEVANAMPSQFGCRAHHVFELASVEVSVQE